MEAKLFLSYYFILLIYLFVTFNCNFIFCNFYNLVFFSDIESIKLP